MLKKCNVKEKSILLKMQNTFIIKNVKFISFNKRFFYNFKYSRFKKYIIFKYNRV